MENSKEDCLERIVREINSELGSNFQVGDIRFSQENSRTVIINYLAKRQKYWYVTALSSDRSQPVLLGELTRTEYDDGEYTGINQQWDSWGIYTFHPNTDCKSKDEQ
jgi:hypothetical protein